MFLEQQINALWEFGRNEPCATFRNTLQTTCAYPSEERGELRIDGYGSVSCLLCQMPVSESPCSNTEPCSHCSGVRKRPCALASDGPDSALEKLRAWICTDPLKPSSSPPELSLAPPAAGFSLDSHWLLQPRSLR